MKIALVRIYSNHLIKKKLFLLINSIDKYEGRGLDITSFIKEIGAFPNVKVLVSSRPLGPFVAAFLRFPKLNLLNLT